MTGQPIDRRKLLGGLTLGASGLLLSGCDKLNANPSFRSVLASAENLHRRSQRLVAPGLAREYAASDMSPFFRTNGNVTASSPEYQAHAANRFTDWKLIVDGMWRGRSRCRSTISGRCRNARRSRVTTVSRAGAR